MKRPVGITVLATLALVVGLIELVSALGFLGVSMFALPAWMGVASGVSSGLTLGVGVLSLVIAVAIVAFGIGALQLRSWAWMTGIVVFGLELIGGVVQLFSTGIAIAPVLIVVLSVVILGYLYSTPVREAFGAEMGGGHYTSHHPTAA